MAKWLPGRLIALGTDGYGRSDTRADLRNYFEVDARFITFASLHALATEGQITNEIVTDAMKRMEIDPDKIDPMSV